MGGTHDGSTAGHVRTGLLGWAHEHEYVQYTGWGKMLAPAFHVYGRKGLRHPAYVWLINGQNLW